CAQANRANVAPASTWRHLALLNSRMTMTHLLRDALTTTSLLAGKCSSWTSISSLRRAAFSCSRVIQWVSVCRGLVLPLFRNRHHPPPWWTENQLPLPLVRRKTFVGRPGRRRESLASVHFVPTDRAPGHT